MSTMSTDTPPAVLPNDGPRTLAVAYLGEMHFRDEVLTLRYWRRDFYRWQGGAYKPIEAEELRAHLWRYLDTLRVRKGIKSLPLKPTSRDVNGALDAMAGECQVFTDQMPAWLDGQRPAATDVVAFENGLMDVGKYVRTRNALLLPPTPLWFSRTVLPYKFTPEAHCKRWLTFLNEVLDDDADRVRLLQQWFGYCLTSDTSQQKMMLIVGPPRSGKGTITRMLERLSGKDNCATPSLSTLGERFGLTTLLGKTVALCSDAHLGREKDTTGILETLKNIIGEDSRDVDRKNRDPLSGVRLGTRFTVAVNEMPRLTDASAAMVPRLLVLPMHNSYVGKEDRTLDIKLAIETPGVLLWALDGLRELRADGQFVEPMMSVQEIRDFERLSSPLKAFVEDCCETGLLRSVLIEALYGAYKKWCEQMNSKPMNLANFGTKLRAAAPSVGRTRLREGGQRVYSYEGIDLKPEWNTGHDFT
jgi:putative DNA primase/helicase